MTFKELYSILSEHRPYAPGKHLGLCTAPYTVIREGFTNPTLETNKLGRSYIDIILYVPVESYVEMKPFRDRVVNTLKGHMRKTGVETPIIIDNDNEAYTMSIEYVLQKRLEE